MTTVVALLKRYGLVSGTLDEAILDARCQMPDANGRCKMRDARCRMQDAGCKNLRGLGRYSCLAIALLNPEVSSDAASGIRYPASGMFKRLLNGHDHQNKKAQRIESSVDAFDGVA